MGVVVFLVFTFPPFVKGKSVQTISWHILSRRCELEGCGAKAIHFGLLGLFFVGLVVIFKPLQSFSCLAVWGDVLIVRYLVDCLDCIVKLARSVHKASFLRLATMVTWLDHVLCCC